MGASGIVSREGSLKVTPTPRRQHPSTRILAFALTSAFGLLIFAFREEVTSSLSRNAPELALWALIVVVINLFHFESESLQFTLDLPMLLAVGALYHPAVAALIAFAGSIDVREFSGRVTFSRALTNRSQVALSLLAASLVFHATTSVRDHWPLSLLGMAAAFGCFCVLNAFFVSTMVSLRRERSWLHVMMSLSVGRPLEYLVTYLGYGVLALVLARMFQDVGSWAVVLFLIPIMVAHLALVRAEGIKALAGRLKTRERLLERLSDRILEERKDERIRIASDLHDEVLQNITKIWMQSRFVEKGIAGDSQLARDIRELVSDAEWTLTSLRQVISDLQRSPLGRGGLVATLEQLVRDLKLDWGKRILFKASGERFDELSADVQLAAYQIAREGVVNALKHSRAQVIDVRIERERELLIVRVSDDGIGFDPDQVDSSQHFGLGLTKERLLLMRGRLEIETGPRKGTSITATLPILGAPRV